MRKLLFILISVVIVVATSCKKLPTYPDVPVLEYKSLTFGESDLAKTFTLTVSFTDGDGDVGYHESGNGDIYDDPASPYNNNFVVKLFYLENNDWVEDTSKVLSVRIPWLTPEGAHKALKATIDKTDEIAFASPTTIRLTAFIYDRALHKSNTITTPEFLITP